MSQTVAPSDPQRQVLELSDLVELYGVSQYLPPADWITRLKLNRPRRDMRCLRFRTRFLKRASDLVIASTLIVLLSPLVVLTAVLVKLTSPGPVIFRQVRTGLNLRTLSGGRRLRQRRRIPRLGADRRIPGNDRRLEWAFGRSFVLYKFRTMSTDAEKSGAQLAVPQDPRVTKIGRFLRRTRIDELPQLWNVIRGEMSLVGPRPERPEFIEQLSNEIPDYLQRLGLKPGLTGLAQVINGYDVNLESLRRKVALDLLYLQNCCLWNDVKVMWRTVGVVLTGKGAL